MKTIIKPIYLLSLLGALLLALGPAQAKDMILTAIKPNRIIIADPDSMKITRQIEVENAGPSISTVVPSRDGKSAFMSGNKFESIIKIDLDSGKELMRIDLSDDATRVKAMFGMDVSPDDSTIAVYENPVEIMKSEYRVLSTRISLYDANTCAQADHGPGLFRRRIQALWNGARAAYLRRQKRKQDRRAQNTGVEPQ
jgi:hypothetical protein